MQPPLRQSAVVIVVLIWSADGFLFWALEKKECSMTEILWNWTFRIWNEGWFFFQSCFSAQNALQVPAPLRSLVLLHLKYFKEKPTPVGFNLVIEFLSSVVCTENPFRKVWEWQYFAPCAIPTYPVWECPAVFENRCGQEPLQLNTLMKIYSVLFGFLVTSSCSKEPFKAGNGYSLFCLGNVIA